MPDPFDRVEDAVVAAMEAAGAAIRDDVRARLDVPGPAPSKEGEAPRRQSGNLRDKVRHEVTGSGGRLRLAVSADTPYARRLEEMGRPFLSAAFKDWQGRLPRFLSDHVNGAAPTPPGGE